MAKFEMDMSRFTLNDVDLSDQVQAVVIDHHAPDSAESPLVGLKETTFSLTLDNAGGFFEPGGAFFAPQPPLMRATYAVPDGRWQRVKHRLKQFRLLRWLKVRYVDYSFTGYVEPWPDGFGFTLANAVGPMTKGTETR